MTKKDKDELLVKLPDAEKEIEMLEKLIEIRDGCIKHQKSKNKELNEDVEILGSRISLYEDERKLMEDKYLTAVKVINKLREEAKKTEIKTENSDDKYEPYHGWCDVRGCDNEGANGGACWRETGYWRICHKHSAYYRAGNKQPKMRQSAIDREKTRGKDGTLP